LGLLTNREGSLADLMKEYGRRPELGSFLKGLRVSTKHLTDPSGKPKVQYKTIVSLGNRSSKEATFISDDGSTVSVVNYFKKSKLLLIEYLLFYFIPLCRSTQQC